MVGRLVAVLALLVAGVCFVNVDVVREHPYAAAGTGALLIVLWLGWMLFRNPLVRRDR